jgi:hypothetical protein
MKFTYEYTDTFAGDANYCWVKRGSISVPELTHYGYDGSHGYVKANKAQSREIVRKVKACLGITGIRCNREDWGETIVLRPRGRAEIVFIDYADD